MKILKIEGDDSVVSMGKVERRINIRFITNPKIGDYVIAHAGFAIEKLNPRKAAETLRLLREIL